MRESGILMPLSSLPSRTGVGELGAYTLEFINYLAESGVKIWQILPMNPVGYGNSPYQPYSSSAGDELYISLDELYKEELLSKLPPAFLEKERRVRYDEVRAWKESYLREAFENFKEKLLSNKKDFEEFSSQKWVRDYSVYRAFGKANGGKSWVEWEASQKDWVKNPYPLPPELQEEAAYQTFLQYIFMVQWFRVKEAANEKGIRIMGDLPFYVGLDSADVWAGKDNFLLDTDGRPIFIAGVPPDYFSATGQRWGNPIYDWDYLKKTEYAFWVERIGYCQKLFDIVRIDHFRAFDTFWKIPASCPTAIDGEWVEAPGYEAIDTLLEKIPGLNLVAEDLGLLRPEVLELKNHYHLKGMKILQFALNTSGKYVVDCFKENHQETENMIMYTGTHDNDTLMEWYGKLSPSARRKVRRFLKKEGLKCGSVHERLLKYTWKSVAEYAIIPMADLMGMGREGHINTPGTVGSPNWEWRMPYMEPMAAALKKYRAFLSDRL